MSSNIIQEIIFSNPESSILLERSYFQNLIAPILLWSAFCLSPGDRTMCSIGLQKSTSRTFKSIVITCRLELSGYESIRFIIMLEQTKSQSIAFSTLWGLSSSESITTLMISELQSSEHISITIILELPGSENIRLIFILQLRRPETVVSKLLELSKY